MNIPEGSKVISDQAAREVASIRCSDRQISSPRPNRPVICQTVLASVVGLLLVSLSGCGQSLRTNYGSSKGVLARRSINGFTTFRDAFSEAGFEQRDLTRLTQRARKISAIVWTPMYPGGIETKTTNWMDSWLRQSDRTLVYVIPDSGSESDYYRKTRQLAGPGQRMEYRRRNAEQLIKEHRWQVQRQALETNGWFFVRPKVQTTRVAAAEGGPDADRWDGDELAGAPRRFEWVLEAVDTSRDDQAGAATNAVVGPGQPPIMGQSVVTQSSGKFDFEPVLVSESGDVLVASITSSKWGDSNVLVVAGGSLLTNFGLTDAGNRRLADALVVSCGRQDSFVGLPEAKGIGEGRLVGFSSAVGGIPVSEAVAAIPRAVGAELLTVFPMSFVTVHIAILGFVVCLMLLPVFGRPKRIDRGVLTHFGDHLDAVANLMRRAGGERLARSKISDYFKRVRKETSGPWVIEERPQPMPAKGTGMVNSESQETHAKSAE